MPDGIAISFELSSGLRHRRGRRHRPHRGRVRAQAATTAAAVIGRRLQGHEQGPSQGVRPGVDGTE